MKLYTEEQVREIFKEAQYESDYGIPSHHTLEDLIVDNNITPIELPSDEEIVEATPYTPVDANSYKLGLKYGFRDGAHWMKEQILNQK